MLFPPDLRPQLPKCCYFRVPLPACALEITKASLFVTFSTDLRPRNYQSVATFVFPSPLAPSKLPKCDYLSLFPPKVPRAPLPACALDVTKVLLVIVVSIRLAPSKLSKCRYFRVSLLSCALEVTKVSISIYFQPSKLPKCRYFPAPLLARALEINRVS